MFSPSLFSKVRFPLIESISSELLTVTDLLPLASRMRERVRAHVYVRTNQKRKKRNEMKTHNETNNTDKMGEHKAPNRND